MEEHEQTLLRWLRAHDPDDWHQVAIDWNWDAGLDILTWIAEQPECDRATAQYLILNGGPDAFRGISDREELMAKQPYNAETFDLLFPTIKRWHEGFYTRSQIATYGPKHLQRLEHIYRLGVDKAEIMPWKLDASVFQELQGREFSYRYTEGWPPEVEADLRARGINY